MTGRQSSAVVVIIAAIIATSGLFIRERYVRDIQTAIALAAEVSEVLPTAYGPIEVQQAGTGTALLMIDGSGGGHDQGIAWARPLVR